MMMAKHMLLTTIAYIIIQGMLTDKIHTRLSQTIEYPDTGITVQQVLHFTVMAHDKLNDCWQPTQVVKVIQIERQVKGNIKCTLIVELMQSGRSETCNFVVLSTLWRTAMQLSGANCKISNPMAGTEDPKETAKTVEARKFFSISVTIVSIVLLPLSIYLYHLHHRKRVINTGFSVFQQEAENELEMNMVRPGIDQNNHLETIPWEENKV